MLDLELTIYIPDAVQFMMYFDNDAVQVDLDQSYLNALDTAVQNAQAIAAEAGLEPRFLHPKNRTTNDLPDIPTQFAFMCCPRSISDLSSKIGLGYIGPKVRRIIRAASFPVLMTSAVFKPWKSIVVLFGGSDCALNALRYGIQLAKRSGYPLDLFTQLERDEHYYEQQIRAARLDDMIDRHCRHRYYFDEGEFTHNLYGVPHDALVLSGAYGHGLIKQMLFGSKLEIVQSTMTNNMLLSGPRAMVSMATH
jgi:nucleotide-binding universal stress UspA family protein